MSLSVRERNGMYALLLIFFVQIFALYYLHFLSNSQVKSSTSWLTSEAEEWMQLKEPDHPADHDLEKKINPVSNNNKNIKYFYFNPNTCSSNDLLSLGLSIKQAKVIEKFRAYGDGFRSKSDFAKLYCLSEKEYKNLEPWIELPDTFRYLKKDKSNSKQIREKVWVDLSTADSAELLKIPGIGPSFAGRITRYGARLGAYYSLEQLKEVWGITDTIYLKVKPFLYISDSLPGNIKLNEISLKDLGKHPYVGYPFAKVIVSYRDQHGSFKSLDELRKVPIFTEEFYRKLLPYLSL